GGELGRRGGEGNGSARLQDPKHLSDRSVGPWREDVPELTQHHIVGVIGEGKLLHVALAPFDVHAGNPRVLASAFEELRRQVQAGHSGSHTGSSDSHHSGAARYVQHPLSRAWTRATDQLSRSRRG